MVVSSVSSLIEFRVAVVRYVKGDGLDVGINAGLVTANGEADFTIPNRHLQSGLRDWYQCIFLPPVSANCDENASALSNAPRRMVLSASPGLVPRRGAT
jgi:hypothetical protein